MRQIFASRCLMALAAVASLSQPAPAFPDDDKSYRAGIGLLNKGVNDLAAAELRAYLRDNPDGSQAPNARYSLAVCLVRLSKHADAIAELEPVLALSDFEFAPDALLLRAQCATATGDDAGAVTSLNRLIAGFPKFAQLDRATAALGESLYRLGKLDDAVTTLAHVTAKWPTSPVAPRAGLFAAMSEFSLRKFEAAASRAAHFRAKTPQGEHAANLALIEAQCRHQLASLPAATNLFEIAASTGQGSIRTEALLGLASVARSQRDFARAQQALTQAANPPPTGTLRERLTLEQGRLLLDQDKPDAALKLFAQLQSSAAQGQGDHAAYWAARCEARLGEFDAAIDRLSRAAKSFPKSELVPDMLFDRAAALAKAGKDPAALQAWEQWQAQYAHTDLAPDALLAQAWCAHRLGKFDETRALGSTLTAKYPKRAEEEAARLLVAENEFEAGRFEPALNAYTQLLSRSAQSKHAWRSSIRRGLCLLKLQRDDEAQTALETALSAKDEQDPALRRAALMALGERSFARQDWASGEKWFAALAAQTPGGEPLLDALLRQGICIERQQRFTDALPVFERVLKSAPTSPQSLHARFECGQSLIELGKLDEARTALEAVVAGEKGPPLLTPHAQRHLATIASRQARHEDAASILSALSHSAAPGAKGESQDSLVELGSAWLSAGKFDQAEKVLTGYLASNASAKQAPQAHARLAIAINRQGRHAEALKQLDAIGDTPALDAPTRAAATYERALALRSLGRDPEAAKAYRTLLTQSAPTLEAYAAIDLAQIESKAEHHDEALKLITRSLSAAGQLDPASAAGVKERATYLRAASLLRLAKPGEAADTLKDFANAYPRSAMLAAVSLLRGEALLASAQAKAAVAEFSRAIASTDSDDVRTPATLRLGEALAACQDWPASERAYTTFLDRTPKSDLWFQARFGQGWARENQGRHSEAIEAYREIVSRHKGTTAARAQFQIGECLYAQKKHEEAASELLKTDVLFDYPEWSAAAIYEAGRCFAEMGRPDDSARQFDDVIKRFPKTRWAEMAKERREATTPAPIPGRPKTDAQRSK
ncbi:MAG: tetratricopeptide repeat protein [Planctomycetota bacterium]